LPWRDLEHPADIRLEIEAENLSGLVKECAKAFYFVELEFLPEVPAQGQPGMISINEGRGGDLAGLLVAWMNELLYFLDTAGQLFFPLVVEIDSSAGRLVARGIWQDAPSPGGRVKAVTYGGLELDPGPPWRFKVIMDV
jgi:SHS2 domain-containing protein